MNDTEFIELLNLYVDHEITSADAARLEAEVAQNPSRARIYREYCSMQKACMILAEQFRETAPFPGAERKVTRGTRTWSLSFAAAGLAAAACLALLLVPRHPAVGGAPEQRASLASASFPSPSVVAPTVVAARLESGVQPLYSLHLDPSTSRETALLVVSSEQQDPFAWMNQVQLAPIQRLPVGPLTFDPKAAAPVSPSGTLNGSQKSQQGPVEMTAFQLQLDK
jgi:hypothetical protein